jgi:hypothetical protein
MNIVFIGKVVVVVLLLRLSVILSILGLRVVVSNIWFYFIFMGNRKGWFVFVWCSKHEVATTQSSVIAFLTIQYV